MHTTPSASATALPRIALIESGWHSTLVSRIGEGFREALQCQGAAPSHIDTFPVPGCLEIPLTCQRLARRGEHAIIVAAGLVVDGGIYRHEFVAATVLDGMMRVQLGHDIPILSVVLTPRHFSSDPVQQAFFADHLHGKGVEAAHACRMLLDAEGGAGIAAPAIAGNLAGGKAIAGALRG